VSHRAFAVYCATRCIEIAQRGKSPRFKFQFVEVFMSHWQHRPEPAWEKFEFNQPYAKGLKRLKEEVLAKTDFDRPRCGNGARCRPWP
jgi:hypothetical protein